MTGFSCFAVSALFFHYTKYNFDVDMHDAAMGNVDGGAKSVDDTV